MKTQFILFLLLILPITAFSGSYYCEIRDVYEPTANGSLIRNPDLYKDWYVGKAFGIDKATGTILVHRFMNTAAFDVRIIDKGSPKSKFKLLSLISRVGLGAHDNLPFVNVKYIEVDETSRNLRKPFVGIALGLVLTGVCEG